MTKSELIDCIIHQLDNAIDPVRVQGAVNQIIEYLGDNIARGEKIEVRKFGSFSVRSRAARIARNPKTGEVLDLDAVRVCYFKPGKFLKARVNNESAADLE